MNFKSVKSSNLQGYHYDGGAQRLSVKFSNGTVFHYDGVPADAVQEFEKAESKGSHFARHIRNTFKATKQED